MLEAEVLEPALVTPTLTATEQKELAQCEETIRRGWQSFVAVGEALNTIHDQRLYRDRYERFEDYYRAEWQYQKSQVYRLMGAAKVVRVLSPIGENAADDVVLPVSEAQVRPLVGLDMAEIKRAWQKVTKEAKGGRITARLVQRQVQAIVPRVSSPNKPADSSDDSRVQRKSDPVTAVEKALNELLEMIPNDGGQREKASALQQRIIRLFQRRAT